MMFIDLKSLFIFGLLLPIAHSLIICKTASSLAFRSRTRSPAGRLDSFSLQHSRKDDNYFDRNEIWPSDIKHSKLQKMIMICGKQVKKVVMTFCTAMLLFLLSLSAFSRPSSASTGSSFTGSSFSSIKTGSRSSTKGGSSSSGSSNSRRERDAQKSPSSRSRTDNRIPSMQPESDSFPESSRSSTQFRNKRGRDNSAVMMVRNEVFGRSEQRVGSKAVLFTIFSIFGIFSSLPWLSGIIKGRLGINSAAVYQVQIAYRLNKEDLKSLLRSIDGSSDINENEELAVRIERMCISLLRQQDYVVGGSMVEYRNSPWKVDRMKEIFDTISINERVKFDEVKEDKLDASSLLIVTFVLLSVGPVLRNNGWSFSEIPRVFSPFSTSESTTSSSSPLDNLQRKNILKIQQIKRFLYTLPLYLRSLDKLQLKFDQEDERLKPGFDIGILWTPSNSSELLSETEVKTKWPSIQFF
jgi:uncharacterized membrane protein